MVDIIESKRMKHSWLSPIGEASGGGKVSRPGSSQDERGQPGLTGHPGKQVGRPGSVTPTNNTTQATISVGQYVRANALKNGAGLGNPGTN